MHRSLLVVVLMSVALLLSLYSLTPSQVNAEPMLQEVPRFDGYRIYFSENSWEASRFDRTQNGISRLAGLLQRLGAELYTLNWNQDLNVNEIDLLVIAGPWGNLGGDRYSRLWAYINEGGRVMLITDPLEYSRNRPQNNPGLSRSDAFFALAWQDIGINVRNDVVVFQTGETDILQPPPSGRIRDNQPTPTPLPLIESQFIDGTFTTSQVNGEHPITANIEGPLAFFDARSIEFDASIQTFDTTPLVFTDENFYGETQFLFYLNTGIAEYNISQDTTQGALTMIAAVEDSVDESRIVVIGDRDFVTNGAGFMTSPSYSAGFLYPENVRLTLNALIWLLEGDVESTVELVFPTPGPTATNTPTSTPTLMPTVTTTPEATSGT